MRKSMNYINSKYFKFQNIKYGFFTRKGGYSKKPYDTLNCSNKYNDKLLNVKKNRKKALIEVKLNKKKLIIGEQFHSNKTIIIKKKILNKLKADAFITKNKDLAIGILTADCAPIFFFDDEKKIIGAAHAGWKGSLKNICKTTVKSMRMIGSKNKDINVIIGPCINYKNYEVDNKLFDKFMKKNKDYKKFFKKKNNNKYYFKFGPLLRYQLQKLKVKNIVLVNEDTFSNKSKFYSHRRKTIHNESATGRLINIIGFS